MKVPSNLSMDVERNHKHLEEALLWQLKASAQTRTRKAPPSRPPVAAASAARQSTPGPHGPTSGIFESIISNIPVNKADY
ncbi:unnamed protein product [Parnassius apollo]|uniref:(apollo) hypothetical protein n=1 Tax=Parnassius apollo TaxID=110799 RepID=A0A8S3YEQ6_PARAO|nr:unnamed protein product [Parnassius apollo]